MADFVATPPLSVRPDLTPTAPCGAVRRAVVEVGTIETEYLRAGSGPAVLYLGPVTGDPECEAVFGALTTRFRVTVPQSISPAATMPRPDGGGSAFANWMEGFLDGLGIVRAGLVADESFGAEAARFALAHPGQIGRLVILHPATSAAPLGARGAVLAVRRGGAQSIAEMLRFLAADDGATAP
jgi:pimeloyl-ACP methyl ester carboxylesterase